MEQQKLLRANYLDILFDGRNKKYGGYELRRNYAQRTRRATGIVIMAAVLAAAVPLIATALSPDKSIVPPPMIREHELADIPIHKPDQPVIKVPEPPAVMATVEHPVLKVVEDKEAAEPPKTVDDLKDKAIGFKDNPGPPDGIQPDLGGPVGKGKEVVDEPVAKAPAIPRMVEQMPSFNGDLYKYLNAHLNYPEEAQSSGKEGRVVVQFVVNEDGSISNAEAVQKVNPQLDAEAVRVVSSMPKWKPGKQQGIAVKVYFMLPITFELR